jgi:hypothetical protein
MCTTTLNAPPAPAAMAPMGQVMLPAAPTAGVVHPAALVETKVVLGGVLNTTVAPLTALAAPLR